MAIRLLWNSRNIQSLNYGPILVVLQVLRGFYDTFMITFYSGLMLGISFATGAWSTFETMTHPFRNDFVIEENI